MLRKGYPRIALKSGKGSVGRYMTRFLGLRLFRWSVPLIVYDSEIRLDWRAKDESFEQDDETLTAQALNEETLHFVLQKDISDKACVAWDNLTRDLRIMLQE